MLSFSAILFLGGLFQSSGCPANFQTTSYTVSAITNSAELLLCISKAAFVKGSDGKLNLVLNSSSTAPKCLIYPNGLSPDLSAQLISSGHTGCWSLYPPSQLVAITNIGTPSRSTLSKALGKFKPTQPRIILYPKTGHLVGQQLTLWSSSKTEIQSCVLLGLPCQIRFTPRTYRWVIAGTVSSLPKPKVKLAQAGTLAINLAVSFSVEYRFIELSSWRSVKPNVLANAPAVSVLITGKEAPAPRRIPRLVDKPCIGMNLYGC